MKTAFVHCRVMPWGALSVLKDLIDDELSYDEAKLFTVFSDVKHIQTKKHRLSVVTALPWRINQMFLFFSTHKVPWLSWIFDYRNLMFFYPLLMRLVSRKIRRYYPAHIIISSFAVAKNISPLPGIKTTLYLHSPMQYLWSHYEEYKEKLSWCKWFLFRRIVPKLRDRDLQYTHFDKVYANSDYTAELAMQFYNITATVRYPHIDSLYHQSSVCETPLPYYIFVGRLVTFVRECALIIRLFNDLGVPLVILWSGPDEAYLKSIAKSHIIFVGWIDDPQERVKLVWQAKWLINLTKESFWMGTVEALLLGVPVFGYAQWASKSLVHQDAWILVPDKSMKTLKAAFQLFSTTAWDRAKIAKKTRSRFSK